MIRNTKVTLNIFWDDTMAKNPSEWNWDDICDLDNNESVSVEDYTNITSGRTLKELLDGHTLE